MCIRDRMKMMGDHTSPNMPKAQASKDATMAYFINKNLKANSVFIHYNGTFHSDNFDGINSVSYTHLDVYKRQIECCKMPLSTKQKCRQTSFSFTKTSFFLRCNI